MKRIVTSSTVIAAALLTGFGAPAAVGTLTGPTTHRNLQVFLVHGDTQLEERRYATLSEALERGLVQVRETGNVQELTIENQSKSITVFLNSGDIVKGGRQDRTVRDDLILPPLSGRVPLASFCVEHGRWTQRGHENSAEFSANNKVLSSRKEKLAARYENNQSSVWSSVAEQQSYLNGNGRGSQENLSTCAAPILPAASNWLWKTKTSIRSNGSIWTSSRLCWTARPTSSVSSL